MSDDGTVISLSIPATPEFLRLARLAAADVASRAGFAYDDIEDLRIGVDELCHLLMAPGSETEHVRLTFTLAPDGVTVEGHGPPGASHHAVVQSELSRTIVGAVADEHEIVQDGDVMRFRLLKRAPTR